LNLFRTKKINYSKNMNELTEKNPISIQTKQNKTNVSLQHDLEAIWLNQDKLSHLFNVHKKEIMLNLATILKEDNINKEKETRRIHYVDYSKKPEQAKNETQYSLTIIIKLAFKLNSNIAREFQEWAISNLHRHLIWGASFDINRIKQKNKRITNIKNIIKKIETSKH